MKFGVRECANIVFRAKTPTNIGKYKFKAGQPVLYIDTATTSSVEQATTTVYAQGGRGNVRLISWEGEKTLTFTVEDALLSPISLAMLSGADLFQGNANVQYVHFHTTSVATLDIVKESNKLVGYIDLSGVLGAEERICPTNDSPIYVIFTDGSGDLTGEMIVGKQVEVGSAKKNGNTYTWSTDGAKQGIKITEPSSDGIAAFASADAHGIAEGDSYAVFVDYYLDKKATAVDELQIAADNFAGNYYVEADTLFRRKSDGVDMPANLTFPNVKIQSNLTFQLSGTGDPSTFTFTMDALPGYTYFDKSREVLCVIQVIEDQTNADKIINPVMPHNDSLEHEKDEIDDSRYIGYGYPNPTKGNQFIDISVSGTATTATAATISAATIPPSTASIGYVSADATIATVSATGEVTAVNSTYVGNIAITATATDFPSATIDVPITTAAG